MMTKTIAKDNSSVSEYQKSLSLHMIILHNFRGLVDTYFTMMTDIMSAKMGQHVSAATNLTQISILKVLGLAIFYNPQMILV